MGGDYEDEVEAEAPAKKGFKPKGAGGAQITEVDAETEETIVSGIRFHQNASKVHFHDDKVGLKCYVPVPQWWAAWQKLKCPAGAGDEAARYQFHDIDNGTLLTVVTENIGDAVITKMKVEAKPAPQTYDKTYYALEAFTEKTK